MTFGPDPAELLARRRQPEIAGLVSDHAQYGEASRLLVGAGTRGTSLCEPLLLALPVDHASVTTLSRPFEPEIICASDRTARRITQAELEFGEGPSWAAAETRSPIRLPDVASLPSTWTVYVDVAAAEMVASIYVLPLRVGLLTVGAVELFCVAPDALTDTDCVHASGLAALIAEEVLQRSLSHLGDESPASEWFTRRKVHQATGMLVSRHGVNAADALALLRAHAFTLDRPLLDVAADVVGGQLDLDLDHPS